MPNVRVLQADALANKNTMNPVVMDNVRAGLAVSPGKRFKLVANLPYNVATPVVSNLLVHPESLPGETGRHDPARTGRADARRAGDRRLRRALGAGAGGGRCRAGPGLAAVGLLAPPEGRIGGDRRHPDPAKLAAVGDLPWFHSVVRSVFLHRRKNLRRVLHGLWRDRIERSEVDALWSRSA